MRASTSSCTAEEQTCLVGEVVGEDGTCSNAETETLIEPANGMVEIDWGETQAVEGDLWKEMLQNIESTRIYMAAVRKDDTLNNVVTECKSRNELCSFWAVKGKICTCMLG
jgi:hypothetical protein